jgi:hypothetical protein
MGILPFFSGIGSRELGTNQRFISALNFSASILIDPVHGFVSFSFFLGVMSTGGMRSWATLCFPLQSVMLLVFSWFLVVSGFCILYTLRIS